MKKTFLFSFILLSAVRAFSQDPETEEFVELSPFAVSSESDAGYGANSTLGGTRIRTELKDGASSVGVVTAQFLSDTTSGMPSVPISVVKRADALLIQFALVVTNSKASERNSQLNRGLELINSTVSGVSGLRFEPREVFLASGDRKASILRKGEVVTSFAHFVVFAELPSELRAFQRVNQVRDMLKGLKLDGKELPIINGPTGLYLRNPNQFRSEILGKIFADLNVVKEGIGSEFEVRPNGLNRKIQMRTCSETDVELWIDYSFDIKSKAEMAAKK